MAIPLLGEKVGIRRGLAVLVGLAGVIVVLRPGQVPLGLGQLAALVSERLKYNKVELLGSYQPGAPMLQLLDDSLERRTLSLFPNGQVAEYELRYKVRYALTMPERDAQQYQFELFRDYQDDPNQALAKAKELELMLGELRQQAANRILRQLSRLQ